MNDNELKDQHISEDSRRILKSGNQIEINHRLLLISEANYRQNLTILEEIATLKQQFGIWQTPRGRFISWMGGLFMGGVFLMWVGWVSMALISHAESIAAIIQVADDDRGRPVLKK